MPNNPLPQQAEAPARGRLTAGVHRLPLRVYYAETDAGGVVYHARYLDFAERARAEMLRCAGFESRSLVDGGIAFAVRSCTLDFVAPARLDDALVVESRVTQIGGASLTIEQVVKRVDRVDQGGTAQSGDTSVTADRDLVTIIVRLVCIDARFQPQRVPQALRDAFAPGLEAPSEPAPAGH